MILLWSFVRDRYTVICPGYKNTRVFFGLIMAENTPRSSRILRQLVCTDTCMGFNGISESFFYLRTPYEALFCSQCITLVHIFLSQDYTEILNSIIIPSFYTIPNTAGSESFTESHPILRKDKFTTNINL